MPYGIGFKVKNQKQKNIADKAIFFSLWAVLYDDTKKAPAKASAVCYEDCCVLSLYIKSARNTAQTPETSLPTIIGAT